MSKAKEQATYHGEKYAKRSHEAFKDMHEGIDYKQLAKTITWDEDIDINDTLDRMVLKGEMLPVRVRLDIKGAKSIMVNAKSIVEFERQYHYLSQPSRIRESERSALSVLAAAKAVPYVVESFVDYSGRLGAVSTLVATELKPKRHIINEAAAEWIPHLKSNFKHCEIHNMPVVEAFSALPACDLALVDYCSWIPSRDMESIIPVLEAGHASIILTDASAFFWHLNRNSYCNGLFDAPEKHDDYVKKLSNWFAKNYGYSIIQSVKRHTIVTHTIVREKKAYSGKVVQYVELYHPSDVGYHIHITK